MANKFEKLQNEVMSCSKSKGWNEAILEWDIVDFAEDSDMEQSCKCGKENIKYLYTISNKVTGSVLEPIGSKCIKKFGREDMREATNIYEQLFKLVNARRDGKWIELKSDDKYFSKKLIDYLGYEGVFSVNEKSNNYEVLRKFFTQRKELTYKQKRFAKAIIMSDVFPYLDREIANKVKVKSDNL